MGEKSINDVTSIISIMQLYQKVCMSDVEYV